MQKILCFCTFVRSYLAYSIRILSVLAPGRIHILLWQRTACYFILQVISLSYSVFSFIFDFQPNLLLLKKIIKKKKKMMVYFYASLAIVALLLYLLSWRKCLLWGQVLILYYSSLFGLLTFSYIYYYYYCSISLHRTFLNDLKKIKYMMFTSDFSLIYLFQLSHNGAECYSSYSIYICHLLCS